MNKIRTIIFFDGQNLFHGVKEAWSTGKRGTPYGYPSYDVEALSKELVSRVPGRALKQIRFYTGVPEQRHNHFWHAFWTNKLRHLRNRGVYVYKGRINPGGQEKGVDVSIATDLIRLTYEEHYDLAIIVSSDWDFGPAIRLAKRIAASQERKVHFESAFPYEKGVYERRGVPGTDWVHIDKELYDRCLDPNDYRSLSSK